MTSSTFFRHFPICSSNTKTRWSVSHGVRIPKGVARDIRTFITDEELDVMDFKTLVRTAQSRAGHGCEPIKIGKGYDTYFYSDSLLSEGRTYDDATLKAAAGEAYEAAKTFNRA